MKSKQKKEKIVKTMTIGEVISKYPQLADTFLKNGMHCVGCFMAQRETLEEATDAHGIKLDKLLKELNKSVQ